MAILVGVGSSQNRNSAEAADEALSSAIPPLAGNTPSIAILLASSTAYNQQELLTTLKLKLPQTQIVGCSTAGEITSKSGSQDNSIALMVIFSDQMKFIAGVGKDIKANAKGAGRQLAQNILQNNNNEKPKAMFMLPDGLAGNGADIVRGVLEILGSDFMVAGGSAGDDYLFKQTYEYFNDQLLTGSVVGVGLAGNFSFGIGVRHGWIPIGTSRVATKSSGNILYELDNKPAIEIYKDYFGADKTLISKDDPLAKVAITYPLGIPAPNKDGYLIRDPLTMADDGSITCAAEVPQGSEVYLMIGSQEEAIEAAADAVQKAVSQVAGKTIKAVMLFDCIARKKLLMTKKQEEVDKILSVLGGDIPVIGFYTYGEQAPLGGEVVTCSFHNETDVIFVIAE